MMMMGDGEAASVALLDSYVLRDELVLVMERPLPSMDLFDYILHRGGHLQEEEAKVRDNTGEPRPLSLALIRAVLRLLGDRFGGSSY